MNKLLTLLFLCTNYFLGGQHLDMQWAQAYDNTIQWDMTSENDFIQATHFTDSLILDGNIFYSIGAQDILFYKTGSNGEIIWAQQMENISHGRITSLDVNANNELCIMGTFQNSFNVSLVDNQSHELVSSNAEPHFVVCYNSDLSLKWSRIINVNSVEMDNETLLLTDESEVVLTGSYTDSIQVENTTGSEFHIQEGKNSYAIKFGATGEIVWSIYEGLLNDSFGFQRDISYNGQNLILTYGGAAFRSSIVRLDIDTGNIIWEKEIACTPHHHFSDAENNIYVVGSLDQDCQTDWDEGPNEVILDAISLDTYLVKYNQDGKYQWVKNIISGNMIDTGTSLTQGADGNIYVTGCIQSTADFDPSPDEFVLQASGFEDVFIAGYDNDGNFLWAENFGGNSFDIGFNIKTSADTLFVQGVFNGSVDFDLSSDEQIIDSENNGDDSSDFLVKYLNCPLEDCLSNVEEILENPVNVFPNPVYDKINVVSESPFMAYRLVDENAQQIKSKEFTNSYEREIDMRHLPSGIYFLELVSTSGNYWKRIVKM